LIEIGQVKKMRMAIADHHPQALWALKTILQEQQEFEITGEVMNQDDLLALMKLNPTDLVLVDWELPGRSSMEDLITEMRAAAKSPIIVVMGSKPEFSTVALRCGPDAFVSKSDQPTWLLEALQKFEKKFRKNQVK
jgi:two-component system, NarL family, invasion response regulator UvrY